MGQEGAATANGQRSALRSAVDLPIALSRVQARDDFVLFEARTCNQSDCGLCIHTRQKLCKQLLVFIRALKADVDSDYSATLLKNAVVGEVRWCHPIEGRQGVHYAAGVKYL